MGTAKVWSFFAVVIDREEPAEPAGLQSYI
jgi:hypothetical protein